MTPEEQMLKQINDAFKPFFDRVIMALNGLLQWKNENKELFEMFEKLNAERERLQKEGNEK